MVDIFRPKMDIAHIQTKSNKVKCLESFIGIKKLSDARSLLALRLYFKKVRLLSVLLQIYFLSVRNGYRAYCESLH